LASENDQPIQIPSPLRALSSAAAVEATRRGLPFLPFEPVEEGAAEALEIEATFRRRLGGLRRLPRHERSAALRAAREWRLFALKALREKRARERIGRYVLWRHSLPPPRQPE
jgi:hypothetical protein